MAYTHFKITKLPIRIQIKIPTYSLEDPVPLAIKDHAYPIALKSEMVVDTGHFLGVPLDAFSYKLLNDETPPKWSEEIDVAVNKNVDSGAPTCTAMTFYMQSHEEADITGAFPVDQNSDRIEVMPYPDAPIGGLITVNGEMLKPNKKYMIYDFKKVMISSGAPVGYFVTQIAKLMYRLGNKNGMAPNMCQVDIMRRDYASIHYLENDTIETDIDFSRRINIIRGAPNSEVTIKIKTTQEMQNFWFFYFHEDEAWKIPLKTGKDEETIVTVKTNPLGYISGAIQGAPNVSFETPYLFVVTATLLTSAGSSLSVNKDHDRIDIPVYNDESLLSQWDMLESVTLKSSYFEEVIGDVTIDLADGDTLNVEATINKRVAIGKAPFVFDIQPEGTYPGVTISQIADSNKFNLNNLGSGIYKFLAKITDADNVFSTHIVTIVTDNVAVAGTPNITGPAVININAGESINEPITASEGPFTGVLIDGEPEGTYVAAGGFKLFGRAPENPGVYNFTIQLLNINGGGNIFPVTMNVSAVALKCEIDGQNQYEVEHGEILDLTFTATNGPESMSIVDAPSYYDIKPYLGGNSISLRIVNRDVFESFTVKAQNAAGTTYRRVIVLSNIPGPDGFSDGLNGLMEI